MNRKRVFAMVLAATLLVSLLPTTAFALDECTQPDVCQGDIHAEGCDLYTPPRIILRVATAGMTPSVPAKLPLGSTAKGAL